MLHCIKNVTNPTMSVLNVTKMRKCNMLYQFRQCINNNYCGKLYNCIKIIMYRHNHELF